MTTLLHLGKHLFAKAEYENPTGSIKDRAALSILEDAEESGILSPYGTVIEATSGNMGIALAALCRSRGYRCIIVMPDSMSPQRRQLMAAYGAQVVLTPGAEGMTGAIKTAEALHAQIPGSFLPKQFENEAGVLAHYRTTGPEIWLQTQSKVEVLVAGVGTGGTITGIARYLKTQTSSLCIVAVEPASSPLLSSGHAGSHGIEGIGANFLPKILDVSLIDEVVTVTDEAAFATAKALNAKGVPAGISAGANAWAAARFANTGAHTVTVLPDSADRYSILER